MGSCMSGDKQKSNVQFFKKDILFLEKTEIYQPLTTTLFNAMRKHNDIILIFTDNNKAKEFSAVTLDEARSLPPKSLKMMYSFKKLVIVGSFNKIHNDILQLTKSATISSVYVIQPRKFQKFQKDYQIFSSSNQITSIPTSSIPLMVFNSQQLLRPPQNQNEIFIHSIDQENQQIYSKLGITAIIQPPRHEDHPQAQLKYYIDNLKANSAPKVVLLHSRSLGQNALMQILSEYLMFLYEPAELSVKGYLARSLPNVAIKPELATSQILDEPQNIKSEAQSNVDQFYKLFKQHTNQSNPQKTERAYNLLSKLLANIISNPDQQNYRKVKGVNKQMQELLTRSGAGIKLLRLVGFNQNSGFWINELQPKYLKVLRADMDLGYRKSANQGMNLEE